MRRFLSELFRDYRTAKTARRARRAPRRADLQVECLEQRDTPAITYHGGALLTHVEVQPLYLGSDWASNSTLLGQTIQFNGFLNTVVNSSYMDMLTNAGYGVGRGTTSPSDLDPLTINKTQFLTDSRIQAEILSQIKGGGLQMPINGGVADPNRLYVVFVEPGVAVKAGLEDSVHNFLGFHSAFDYQYPVNSGGLQYIGTANVHYAVIAYNGSSVPLATGTVTNASFSWLDAFDNMTEVTSHELAEAVTDPNFGNNDPHVPSNNTPGWFDDQANQKTPGEGEVGDLANAQTVYLYGQYAVQRIADQNDQAMTPAGPRATGAAPMDFVLRGDGTFWVRDEAISIGRASAFVVVGSNSGFVEVATGVASISDQGVDNFGQAMVDVVFSNGAMAEYHARSGNSSPWVYPGVPGVVQQAKAGQGVSYLLMTNGNLYEYSDSTGAATYLDSNVQSIDAGTDAHGVSMVAEVRTDWYTRWVYSNGRLLRESYSQSDAFEVSDSSGPHLIATNVQSVSAGQQGNIAYVTTGGDAYWYSESTNTSAYEASGVAAITAGTDGSGYLLLDMLFTNGRLSQYQGYLWTSLESNVASIGKAHAGVLDLVFNGGDAYTDSLYSSNGLSFLSSNTKTAA